MNEETIKGGEGTKRKMIIPRPSEKRQKTCPTVKITDHKAPEREKQRERTLNN